jgi:hypothetical protein
MVRFTPGIECHTHEYIRTGHLDSKFGFDPDQLETVLRHLAGIVVRGQALAIQRLAGHQPHPKGPGKGAGKGRRKGD